MGRVFDGDGRKLGGANAAAVTPRRVLSGPLEKASHRGSVLTTVSQKYTPCSLTQSVETCNILLLFVEVVLVVGSGTFS